MPPPLLRGGDGAAAERVGREPAGHAHVGHAPERRVLVRHVPVRHVPERRVPAPRATAVLWADLGVAPAYHRWHQGVGLAAGSGCAAGVRGGGCFAGAAVGGCWVDRLRHHHRRHPEFAGSFVLVSIHQESALSN